MRYWKRINQDGKTTTVESYSHNLDIEGAIEINEDEFAAFIESFPFEPKRDLAKEFDDLKIKLKEKGVID